MKPTRKDDFRLLQLGVVVDEDDVGLDTTLRSIAATLSGIPVTVKATTRSSQVPQVIEAHSRHLDINFVQEPDSGPYMAMNQLLNHLPDSSVVWFINTGDTVSSKLNKDHLLEVVSQPDFLWGFGRFSVRGEEEHLRPKGMPKYSLQAHASQELEICHQAVLMKVKLIKDLAGFDESFPIAADLKLMLQLGQIYPPTVLGDHLIVYAPGGISDRNPFNTIRDQRRAIRSLSKSLEIRSDILGDLVRLLRWSAKNGIRRLRSKLTSA